MSVGNIARYVVDEFCNAVWTRPNHEHAFHQSNLYRCQQVATALNEGLLADAPVKLDDHCVQKRGVFEFDIRAKSASECLVLATYLNAVGRFNAAPIMTVTSTAAVSAATTSTDTQTESLTNGGSVASEGGIFGTYRSTLKVSSFGLCFHLWH
jgi:hypothetical protein